MVHLPILRAGRPYESLDRRPVPHFQSGEPEAEVSQANRGLIAKDLMQAEANRHALSEIPVESLLDICGRAADLFENETLPAGRSEQSPDDYVRQLSATTGMPHAMCRLNMKKICLVLREMRQVLGGLTRNLNLDLLDTGWRRDNGQTLSFMCEADSLGAILPSNSPGVHSLWLPAIPLKVPLVLKPGSQEPWTPFRIAQALMAAGCPPEAIGYYPTDYGGAAEILLRTRRSMLFGDENTVRPWRQKHGVQIHGPGWSKVIVGEDAIDDIERHLDVIVESVVANGGRSCLNCSGVWVPSRGAEVAQLLAERLGKIVARGMKDPEARIAAFANKRFARLISDSIDAQLRDGAVDLTEKVRNAPRYAEVEGAAFLQPTVVHVDGPDHSLAQAEYLFPFVSVVEVPQARMLDTLGPTLVGTVLSEDPAWLRSMLDAPQVDRLNIGPIPTIRISWDQPHEGNLFEHLYKQRSLQFTGSVLQAQA